MDNNRYRQTRKAERSQAAFTQFIDVVSHDLSAPLRHMRYFSVQLINAMQEQFDDTQHEFSRHITDNIDKMEAMLAAVLQYSRLVSGFNPAPDTSTQAIYQLVNNRFSDKLAEINATIHFPEEDHLITADARQLVQALTYLVDNAIKFRSRDRLLEIIVTATIDSRVLHLTIEDNGNGLDPQDYDFALQILRQVGTRVAGIGAGLALATCVAENHEGTLSLQTAPSQGLLVTMSIPLVLD